MRGCALLTQIQQTKNVVDMPIPYVSSYIKVCFALPTGGSTSSGATTQAIAQVQPLLLDLSLKLLSRRSIAEARAAGKAVRMKKPNNNATAAVDLSFDRFDINDTPLGHIVDAAISAALPASLLQRLAGDANASANASANGSGSEQSNNAATLQKLVHKLSVVLKEQLHGFDERRLAVYRIMQARLAAFDQAQRGDVGYAQRVLQLLREVAVSQSVELVMLSANVNAMC